MNSNEYGGRNDSDDLGHELLLRLKQMIIQMGQTGHAARCVDRTQDRIDASRKVSKS